MPDKRSPHTASWDARKGSGLSTPQGAPADDLVELAETWSRAPRPSASPARLLSVCALVLVSIVIVVIAGPSLRYAIRPGNPVDLGDLRTRWVSGESTLGPETNIQATLRRLIPTRLQVVQDAADQAARPAHIFFCPLFRVLVLTPEPPVPSTAPASPRLEALVSRGLVSEDELALEVSVTGRLVRAADAPPHLAPFVESYARRLDLPADTLWVLDGGVAPSDARWAIWVCGLVLVADLVALFLLLRLPHHPRSP